MRARPKTNKKPKNTRLHSKPVRKSSLNGVTKGRIKNAVTLSGSSHLRIEKPKVIAPPESEKNLALKTLSMIYQNSEFSGDESRVFRGFLDRFKEGDMKKEELYAFLRENPSIRRKIWDSDIF